MTKIKKKTYKELATEFKKTRKESVYNELYHKMRPGLKSYVYNIIKDPLITDDIVSHTRNIEKCNKFMLFFGF